MSAESLIIAPGIFPISEALSAAAGAAVQWTNPLEHSDWDQQLKNHPSANFFHSTAWANVLTETYGFRPIYLVGRQGGAIQSLLPLMEVESWLTGHRGVALPFTDDCEPLCPDFVSFKKLFLNAMEIGRMRGWDYLEIRGGKNYFNAAAPSVSFYGHSLELPPDENTFFSELKSPVRRAIRKAEKEGVRVEISQELPAVKTFYQLQCQARKKHGLPPQPFHFFKNIHKHVVSKNHGIVVLARRKKAPVAGAIFFQFGERAIYKFGASNDAFQHLRGNNLVMWEAIRHCSRTGSKTLNLGRTSLDNDGLRRFKLGWNAKEKAIAYFRFSLDEEKFVPVHDDASGWHNYFFRALPAFASRMIGQFLYRHWA